jgi:helix-turn-helix protein
MENQNDEVGLSEIAELLGVCRQSAWLLAKTGEIPGCRKAGGLFWIAPRKNVLAYARRRAVLEHA